MSVVTTTNGTGDAPDSPAQVLNADPESVAARIARLLGARGVDRACGPRGEHVLPIRNDAERARRGLA